MAKHKKPADAAPAVPAADTFSLTDDRQDLAESAKTPVTGVDSDTAAGNMTKPSDFNTVPEEPTVTTATASPKPAKKPAAPKDPKAKPAVKKPALTSVLPELKTDWSQFPKESIALADIDTSGRYRTDFGDIPALWESIKTIGMIQPVLVTPDPVRPGKYKLLAGERRFRAFTHGGKTEIPAVVADFAADAGRATDLYLRIELGENEQRQQFGFAEKMKLIRDIEALMPKGSGGGTVKADAPKKATERAKTEARDRVAAAVNWSKETVRKAKAVEAAAKDDPGLFGHLLTALKKDEKSVSRAFIEMEQINTPKFDPAGNAIPDSLKVGAIWAAADTTFDALLKGARGLKKMLNDVANGPAGPGLVASGRLRTKAGENGVSYSHEGLDALVLLLKETIPFSQCPTCAMECGELGKYVKKCPTCAGSGTIGEAAYATMEKANDPAVKKLKELSAAVVKEREAAKKPK